jgi:hypothetical protein
MLNKKVRHCAVALPQRCFEGRDYSNRPKANSGMLPRTASRNCQCVRGCAKPRNKIQGEEWHIARQADNRFQTFRLCPDKCCVNTGQRSSFCIGISYEGKGASRGQLRITADDQATLMSKTAGDMIDQWPPFQKHFRLLPANPPSRPAGKNNEGLVVRRHGKTSHETRALGLCESVEDGDKSGRDELHVFTDFGT